MVNPEPAMRLTAIKTLWFNTGTQCNLSCQNCYIESSPSNNRLSYISLTQVQQFLNEIQAEGHPTEEIGLTGGEPFMNPDIMVIMAGDTAPGFSNCWC
jgi:MoaA/NifB/PqqE/SkfB family radical SAM enzyme